LVTGKVNARLGKHPQWKQDLQKVRKEEKVAERGG